MRRIVPAVALSLCAAAALAADWPNWRGPQHDGISPEKGLVTKWESTPPKVWEAKIGPAFSGISIADGKLYTCGMGEGNQILYCLNTENGEIVWQAPIEKEFKEGNGDGTRATPSVNDGRVYILGALGKLLCCDAQTGKEIWNRQFNAKPQWAYSASVLIEGDLAIATAGGDRGALTAFNKKTGEIVWEAGKGPVGYSTPYPFTMGGQRYVVGFMGKELFIVEPKTGNVLWTTPWETSYDVNAATPIFHDGYLFVASGYKTGSALFKLNKESDKLSGEKVWGVDKVILAKFQSPVLWDKHLYVSDQRELKCVEFLTGKEAWPNPERGIKDSTILIADGHLIVLTEAGELQIAPISPEKYEPISKAEVLKGKSWTVPTLCNGRLYVRNLKDMACYKLTR